MLLIDTVISFSQCDQMVTSLSPVPQGHHYQIVLFLAILIGDYDCWMIPRQLMRASRNIRTVRSIIIEQYMSDKVNIDSDS